MGEKNHIKILSLRASGTIVSGYYFSLGVNSLIEKDGCFYFVIADDKENYIRILKGTADPILAVIGVI